MKKRITTEEVAIWIIEANETLSLGKVDPNIYNLKG
jgi:hypothetical protein